MTSLIARRSILKSAPLLGLAVAGTNVPFIRPSKASTTGSILSVHFDGQTAIRNNGTVQNFPTTNSYDLFIRYQYNSNIPANGNYTFLQNCVAGGTNNIIQIAHIAGTKRNTGYLYASVSAGDGVNGIAGRSSMGSLPSTGWNDIMIQINTNTGTMGALLNAAPYTSFSRFSWAGPFQIPYYQSPAGALIWSSGAMVAGGAYYAGEMAEFMVVAGDPTASITDSNFVNSLVDPTTKLPIRQGDVIVVYDSNFNYLRTVTPQIRLWGGSDIWSLNSPNWTVQPWSWTNPPVSRVDNGPNAFFVSAGALTTTSTLVGDCWGNKGEV